MSVNFTVQDVISGSEVAWKAVESYSNQHHVCMGCLSGHVTIEMIYRAIKNTVADEALMDYLNLLDTARNAALADRHGSHSKPPSH